MGVTLWETFSFSESPLVVPEVRYLLHYLHPLRNKRLPRSKLYGCPKAVYDDVMMWCWEYEPQNRPTFEQVLKQLTDIEFRLRFPDAAQ